ncbi:MAG TPA: phosphoribosylglycinamide synthetase C domain-containing protein, partial [Bryobacteraceae bacterium]|nr:phosphoribosylglycinamide synthetase C domain-containing protein [Bryobacteraceae bacterium]
SVCVVLAAHGYPGTVRTGDPIAGIDAAEASGATVFHAGTRSTGNGQLQTAGGRVLGVTASAQNLGQAIDAAYQAANCIQFAGMQRRSDIGARGLRRY